MISLTLIFISLVSWSDEKPTSRLEKVVQGKTESLKSFDIPMVAPTALEEKTLRAKFLDLCSIERKDFAKKYPAVGEDPQKTCVCLDRAMTDLKSLNVWQTANLIYSGKQSEKHEEASTSSDFFDQAEMNCLVDPNWKVGVFQPEDFDEKWQQIEKAMLVRELKKAPAEKTKGGNSPLSAEPSAKPEK